MKIHRCLYCNKIMSRFRHDSEGNRTTRKTDQQCADQKYCNCECAGNYKASQSKTRKKRVLSLNNPAMDDFLYGGI